MTITKELKNIKFRYDTDLKWLVIERGELLVGLSRVEMFSLIRFIIRVAQKGTPKK